MSTIKNIETKRRKLLKQLEVLKTTKPEFWQKDGQAICRQLASLEDPFWNHEYIGTEMINRRTVFRPRVGVGPDYWDERGGSPREIA